MVEESLETSRDITGSIVVAKKGKGRQDQKKKEVQYE